MRSVLIVGSGASSIHLAKTLVDVGIGVTILDVGEQPPEPVSPDETFDGLKINLEDPVNYYLGDGGESVVLPKQESKFYVFPPSKNYVFHRPDDFKATARQFEPIFSFAAGGLAEAWTGGVYPFNDAELSDFPFGYEDIKPYYGEVVRRIGVSATRDDLGEFSGWFEEYQDPIRADAHTEYLIARYIRKRKKLHARSGFFFGRSRIAALSADLHNRLGCDHLGRCLTGCPRKSIYSPSYTLAELRKNPNFRYLPGRFVTHFTIEDQRVTGIVAVDSKGDQCSYSADCYVLGAGTLCTSKIFLDSLRLKTGRKEKLFGLMDNQQCMMPFITPGMVGKPVDTAEYQFQTLAFGLKQERPEEYVHGQVTTLKAASIHPLIQNLPFDTRTSTRAFRLAHSALAAANIWMHDRRSQDSYVTINGNGSGRESTLEIFFHHDPVRIQPVAQSVRDALRTLGCIAPSSMTRFLPAGSSCHYAGTIPMRADPEPLTCSPGCQSHDFENLYFADGVSFPFLPAKNLTFTLMANAIRVADGIIRDIS